MNQRNTAQMGFVAFHEGEQIAQESASWIRRALLLHDISENIIIEEQLRGT